MPRPSLPRARPAPSPSRPVPSAPASWPAGSSASSLGRLLFGLLIGVRDHLGADGVDEHGRETRDQRALQLTPGPLPATGRGRCPSRPRRGGPLPSRAGSGRSSSAGHRVTPSALSRCRALSRSSWAHGGSARTRPRARRRQVDLGVEEELGQRRLAGLDLTQHVRPHAPDAGAIAARVLPRAAGPRSGRGGGRAGRRRRRDRRRCRRCGGAGCRWGGAGRW